MTLGDAVKERLLAMAPLVSLVGQRVFETVLPQNEKRAAVRYYVIGNAHPIHQRGPVNHYWNRVGVDSYVPIGGIDPLGEVQAVAAAVMGDGLGPTATGLKGWSGLLGGSPQQIHVFGVEVIRGEDSGHVEMEEQRRLVVRQEFRIHWRAILVEV